MIKAAIFDFDGVIINSEPMHEEAWSTLLLKYNIVFTQKMRYEFKGRKGEDNLRRILGRSVSDEKILMMAMEKRELYRSILISRPSLVKGIEEFLVHLHDARFQVALATTGHSKNLDIVFAKFPIKKYFNVIVTSQDIKKTKPDPEIFLKAAKLLFVQPTECVVFEDAPSGVIASKRAGMKVVFVETSFQASEVEETNYNIKDFSHFTFDLIQSL